MADPIDDNWKDGADCLPSVRSAHEIRLVRVVLTLLLLACLGNVLLPEWVDRLDWNRPMAGGVSGKDLFGCLLFGVFLAQLTSLSVWGAMSSWPWYYRWLLMGILPFSLVNMFVVGIQVNEQQEIPLMAFVVMILGGWGITLGCSLILGWLMRRFRVVAGMDGRIVSQAHAQSALPQHSQYGVRFLLIVTMCVALGSFILRNTLPKNSETWVNGLQLLSIAIYFAWLTTGMSILTYLEFRVCLGRRTWALLVLLLLCLTLGPIAFQVVYVWIFGLWNNGPLLLPLSWDLIAFAYPLMLGLVLGNLIAFLPTRWIGFRLVRSDGGVTVPSVRALEDGVLEDGVLEDGVLEDGVLEDGASGHSGDTEPRGQAESPEPRVEAGDGD